MDLGAKKGSISVRGTVRIGALFPNIDFWTHFGTRWTPFGALFAPFGALCAPFGSLLAPFWTLLASFWVPLAPFGTGLATFWSKLDPFGPFSDFWRLNLQRHLEIDREYPNFVQFCS